LIDEAGAQALVQHEGYHWAYRTAQALEAGIAQARDLAQRFGVRHAVLSPADLVRAEPGLAGREDRLAGGLHWLDPLPCSDPGALVAAYAQRFNALGGTLALGDAATLARVGPGWQVNTEDGPVQAAQVVVALGPWSARFARRLGYRLPLFVKRGYHRHFSGGPGLRRPLLDAERAYVLAPMARGVRLTTGAEFAQQDAPATPVQLARASAAARELIELPEPVEPQPWLGSRPCTPDMLPVIGPAPRHPGLWFHCGHAHQGFTLGPVSGRLLAEMIGGGPTLVDPAPYALQRFL
jgi:D-amino-acid dehydrogenase